MSVIQNAIDEELGGQDAGGDAGASAAAAGARAAGGGDTVADALGPVLDFEKTDAEFWAQILQLVVLILILRELRSGS